MERAQWDRIQQIYHSALPMAASGRRAFVANACGDDPVVLKEVLSLLETDESSGSFLQQPVFELGLRLLSVDVSSSNTTSSIDSLIDATIDNRYRIEKKLDQGGVGKVYLARDLQLHDRLVVIKILLDNAPQNPYLEKKFRQEVEALSRTDHPGVVGVLGAGELPDGRLYIVMQYVDGPALRSQITGEGMNLERVAWIVEQMGDALDHIHEKGIFHRDLKPENIMLQAKSGGELVKIVDFGIAKVKDSVVAASTVEETPVGTVLYMSPEQLRGGDGITPASDVFSMGVIAYEMVTGQRPFSAASGAQLLELQREGVRVPPSDLRPNLLVEAQTIILRALSFVPNERYQSAGEFGHQLARALAQRKQTSEEDSWRKSERMGEAKGSNKKRFAVIAGSLMLLCLAVLLGLYIYRQSDSTPRLSRAFTYWLTVQKMRDKTPYQEPFQSNGQEIFDSGDQFRLTVTCADPGYLYLFNEGPPLPEGTSFAIVFPNPTTNNGSASVGADQSVQSNWNTFRGPVGTENFWIVWSTSPVSELESAKMEAFKRLDGGLTDQNLVTVRDYLTAKEVEIKVRTTRYKASQQAVVRGMDDMLIKLVQFEHR